MKCLAHKREYCSDCSGVPDEPVKVISANVVRSAEQSARTPEEIYEEIRALEDPDRHADLEPAGYYAQAIADGKRVIELWEELRKADKSAREWWHYLVGVASHFQQSRIDALQRNAELSEEIGRRQQAVKPEQDDASPWRPSTRTDAAAAAREAGPWI